MLILNVRFWPKADVKNRNQRKEPESVDDITPVLGHDLPGSRVFPRGLPCHSAPIIRQRREYFSTLAPVMW